MICSGYDEDGRPSSAAKRAREGCKPGAAAGASNHLGAIRLMMLKKTKRNKTTGKISIKVYRQIKCQNGRFIVSFFFLFLSIVSFDSPLFGDFSAIRISVTALYFFTIVILSPIVEELLFRGIFLRRFNKELDNITYVILISSILFGLCHNFGGILGAILFGICASILYIKSGNILVPVFAHFLNNLLSFLLGLSGIEVFIQGNIIVIALIIILAIVSNVVLFKAIFQEWPKTME